MAGEDQMHKLFITIHIALFLTGCCEPDNNRGYGFGYDEIGSTGLRVRYDTGLAPTLDQLEAYYREVAACVGNEAPSGPLVVSAPQPPDINGERKRGGIYYSSGTIVIQTLWQLDVSLL